MNSSLRVIVTGLVGLFPVGGVSWDYLQYVVGLARLGHDVYYYEDTMSWPYHPVERQYTSDSNYSVQYIADFFKRYAPDLEERWHYRHLHETSFGMAESAFKEVAQSADIFINVSGACLFPEHLSSRCITVFLDTDPGYNQIMFSERLPWSDNVEQWCDRVVAHDQHFTYAENIHHDDCSIPRVGLDWKTTRMPVVLDLWNDVAQDPAPASAPWTTVMTWNAFKGPLIYQGVEYGSKGSEFEKVLTLPSRVNMSCQVAVGGRNAPFLRLAEAGWQVTDGPSASVSPEQYKQFIAHSRGEFSVAKNVYVATRSGWFSCRSACYLAAGRPIVVQDTGFSDLIPTGRGLFAFTTLDEAVQALETVEMNYPEHQEAARDLAFNFFDSRVVIGQMLDRIGL